MNIVKYIFLTTCFLIILSLFYFLYFIRNREQIPIELDNNVSIRLAKNLLIYESPEIILERHGGLGDGGYIVSVESLKKADILLGYGIGEDNVFEDSFSTKYSKDSYGFDCGIKSIKSNSNKFHFNPICIANSNNLYIHQEPSYNILSFKQQMEKFGFHDKKIFIKMDIEGAEYEAINQILEYSDQITGIALELHIWNKSMLGDAIDILEKLNKKFFLIHLHGNNYAKYTFSSGNIIGEMPSILEISFVNKNIIDNAIISQNQKHPTSLDSKNCKFRKENIFEIKL